MTMDLIDFSDCERNDYRAYGGASGGKISVTYEGRAWMLKFPPKPGPISDLSYINSCLTEYIACHVFESMGFEAQETLLGTFTDSEGNTRRVVACKDFADKDRRLIEFAHLKNTCLNSGTDGYNTELDSILRAIDEQRMILPDRLRTFFWRQFVGDALLANFDRHNGNWGVLVNERIRHADVAPVYDCGSCLFPQLDDTGMERVLSSPYWSTGPGSTTTTTSHRWRTSTATPPSASCTTASTWTASRESSTPRLGSRPSSTGST